MSFTLQARRRTRLLLLLLFSLSRPAQAQDFNYTHYTIHDGLAGSTVYDICQDKHGFIWCGTETGLSRFDGTHFKTFTVKEGLPSNEIFGFYADSHRRMWMNCLRNSVCYYLNGKIHNQQNDILLRQVKLRARLNAFAENKEGDVLLSGTLDTVIVTATGQVASWSQYMGRRVGKDRLFEEAYGMCSLPVGMLALPDYIKEQLKGRFRAMLSPETPAYRKKTDYLGLFSTDTKEYFQNVVLINTQTTTARSLKTPIHAIAAIMVNSHTIAILKRNDGVLLYDTEDSTKTQTYLRGYIVQCVMEDAEGNWWFSTKGSGIFKLSPARCRNYIMGQGARNILKSRRTICIGTDNKLYWQMPALDAADFERNNNKTSPSKTRGYFNFSAHRKQDVYFNCAGSEFLMLSQQWGLGSVKTIQIHDQKALVATSWECFWVDLLTHKAEQRIYRGRTTCAIRHNGSYYVGTLDGLCIITPEGVTSFAGKQNPLLACQISQVVGGPDSTVWIATAEHGVIGYQDGRIIAHFTQYNGLPSDIARSLFLAGDDLWIGTDKGLCKTDVRPGRRHVSWKFAEEDGLNSSEINTIFCDSNLVYVGTPLGISVFDEGRAPHHAACSVLLESIVVSGKAQSALSGGLSLGPGDNNIRFDYACISYLSSGDVTYGYRLQGLSDQWQSTRETFLSYPSLPSGKYVLQLRAVNKFGDQSRLLQYRFEVRKRLTEQIWFRCGLLLLFILVMILIVRYWLIAQHRKEREKVVTAKRLMELEQMALRAQMNPHFIFNCLNSVQRYILNRDEKMANFYLVRFAALVRQTLDHSSTIYIPLAEEIAYLENYLELERLQLAESFEYMIAVEESLDKQAIKIPNMVLQPYIENAVKHGMGSLSGTGRITITFSTDKAETLLACTIEDNGPGPGATKASRQTPQHQSRGTSITGKRIQTLNQLSPEHRDISIQTIDLTATGTGTGTRVIVRFPIRYTPPFKPHPKL